MDEKKEGYHYDFEALEKKREQYDIDNHTIAILIQKSEEQYYNVCINSLQGVKWPDGYQIEVHTVEKGDNFSAQMNYILEQIHAKYKVYIDERMYLIAPDFLRNIIDIFQDKSIGMIGFLDSQSMPYSGNIMEAQHKCGRVYLPTENKIKEYIYGRETDSSVSDVCYVLPTLFATQYDIRWDDQYAGKYYAVMTHCRKYDAEKCRIVVPVLESAWCAYQGGEELILDDVERDRTMFFRMYYPYLPAELPVDGEKNTLYSCGEEADLPGWARFSHPEGIRIGDRTKIHETAICGLYFSNFEGVPRIAIGNDCEIGAYSTISAARRIIVENFVHIADGVHIADYVYDHRNICLPSNSVPMADEHSEIFIGRATRLEANVVVRGNVHIGRGCLIRAGSIITSDIPDYCVVEGNPAHVTEAFSAKHGKWVPVADAEELETICRERREMRPIFSYSFFTYNRLRYLRKSLTYVLEQIGNDELVEVFVSDNASEDDTQAFVQQLQKKYKNLRYYRHPETVDGHDNIHAAIQRSRGEYLIAAGDDDYLRDGALYTVIDHIYKHRDKSLIYLCHSNDIEFVYEGQGRVDYLRRISFYTTFFSAVVMKRSLYDAIDNPKKYNSRQLPQVHIQMALLGMNPNFSIIHSKIWRNGSGEHSPYGYNLIRVFVKNYFDVLMETADLPPDELSAEKKRVIEWMIYPWCQAIKNGVELHIDGIAEIIHDYYGEEPYYPEVVATLKQILGDDYK